MITLHMSDSDLLPVEQQISLLEDSPADEVTPTSIEKLRHLLKREYTRDAITTLEYIQLAKRVKSFGVAH